MAAKATWSFPSICYTIVYYTSWPKNVLFERRGDFFLEEHTAFYACRQNGQSFFLFSGYSSTIFF